MTRMSGRCCTSDIASTIQVQEALDTQAMGNAIYGLQRMSHNDADERSLLRSRYNNTE